MQSPHLSLFSFLSYLKKLSGISQEATFYLFRGIWLYL